MLKEHGLIHEFPQQSAQIVQLRKSNSHFASLADRYDTLDHDIHRLESGSESYTDEQLETLKKKRLQLKDELASLLHNAA